MYCSKCGKEVSTEEIFCLRCGSRKRQQTSPNYGNGWYYLTGSEMNGGKGPFSESAMSKMFIKRTLNGNTSIKLGIDTSWTKASEVPIFQNVVQMPETSFRIFPKNIKLYVIITVVVLMASAIIYTKMRSPIDSLKTENNADYLVPQKTESPDKSMVFSVSRDVLTKDAIITLTNNARSLHGLSALKENKLLNTIAESRARDMLDKQYFAHVSPTGQEASDIAREIGYHYKMIAENIGSGDFYTNQKIVDGWMQSPGHRANILSTEVDEIGAAVLKGKMKGAETYITVQIFGLQSPPVSQNICVAPSDNLVHDIEVKKAEIESLKDQLKRLKNELDAEMDSIETDRRYINNDAQKIQKLNLKINTFNEKSRWYNRVVEDAKAKAAVTESMIDEYNKTLKTYNDCHASH
jgi:uncharacterized protein YkwD